jgi:hypothetical protein
VFLHLKWFCEPLWRAPITITFRGMAWLILLVLVVGGVVLYLRDSFKKPEPPGPSASPSPRSSPAVEEPRSRREVEAETARMLRDIEADAGRLMPKIEAEAAKMQAELDRKYPQPPLEPDSPRKALGLHDHDAENLPRRYERPSWMSPEDWEHRVSRYGEQGRTEREIAETSAYLEQRGPRKPRSREELIARSEEIGIVTRAVYVPKEDEARYITRDEAGLPTLRLLDSGDRLSIWSPIDGGALINPKGPGLRSLGLYSSYARGSDHYPSAFRAADLRKGKWINLKREPDNPHDRNAVAMCAPGSRVPFAYVQRGRAPAVARRMDTGEDMAAVSLRGPGKGRDDDSAFVIVGSRADLTAML